MQNKVAFHVVVAEEFTFDPQYLYFSVTGTGLQDELITEERRYVDYHILAFNLVRSEFRLCSVPRCFAVT
jgi:hypothetical protein